MVWTSLGKRWRAAGLMCVLCVVSCTASESPPAQPADDVQADSVGPTVEAVPTLVPAPAATATPELTLGLPDINAALDVELAPLGTYVVAREGAGFRRTAADGRRSPLEIPVYTTPFGPPRSLLDDNSIDGGIRRAVPLTNWSSTEGVLVLRVIAGGPDDAWLKVQAPTRPHDRFIWVRRNDFDFGFTNQRIEIDLADEGMLTVFDGDDVLLQSGIVQGREQRETPAHVTYVERGIRAVSVSPAYGTAILSMASYSEVLGTFGGAVPSNFLHGTNQPELMGQRVSSGEIRVPNENLDIIIEMVTPGTPVLLFDSSFSRPGRESILQRAPELALTVGFIEGGVVALDPVSRILPQLWRRCGLGQQDRPGGDSARSAEMLCRMEHPAGRGFETAFITAKDGAGVLLGDMRQRSVNVYDVPGGERRMLLHDPAEAYTNMVSFPLRNPSLTRQPLVLWPLEQTPDKQWIRVQAPLRPQRRSVWVRSSDFDVGVTEMRIEIDLAGDGKLSLFDGETEVVSNSIVSGRESRPTSLGESYIDKVIDGTTLSPAYGPYVASYTIFSDVMPTFGGGLPNQAIHGTNQPELMGRRVSSGTIRVPNEVMAFMAELPQTLIGARVLVFDSIDIGREAAIALQQDQLWSPAQTTSLDDTTTELGVPLF